MGINQVRLRALGNLRRRRCGFPASDARVAESYGEEDVGIAQDIVIEEIDCAGAEIAHVQDPAVEWDGHPELVLLVALPMKWQETLRRTRVQARSGREGRMIHRYQRWRLVIAS